MLKIYRLKEKFIFLLITIITLSFFWNCEKETHKKGMVNLIPFALFNADIENKRIEASKATNAYIPNPNETPFKPNVPDEHLSSSGSLQPPNLDDMSPPLLNTANSDICITSICTASVIKPDTDVDRYQNIIVQFTHSMEKGTICASVGNGTDGRPDGEGALKTTSISITSSGKTFNAQCHWGSYRRLILDPTEPLPSFSDVTITITKDAKTYYLESLTDMDGNSSNNTVFAKTFKTVPGFVMSHSINGNVLVDTTSEGFENRLNGGSVRGGLIISASGSPTVTLVSSIKDYSLIKNSIATLKLKRLGNSSDGYTICSGNCSSSTGSFTINLTTSSIPPIQGGNIYYFEIQTILKTYYKSITFLYGNQVADPDSAQSDIAYAFMDGSPGGLGMLSSLLEKFIMSDGSGAVYRTATLTKGSAAITVNSSTGITSGFLAEGAGIQGNSLVLNVSGNTITLNKPIAKTGSGVSVIFSNGQNNNFKIDGKIFSDFSAQPTSNTRRTSSCIDYYSNITYIRNYGDSTGTYGDGYCGGAGDNPGAFQADASLINTATFDMDVFITRLYLPGTRNSYQNVKASLTPNGVDDLGISMWGQYAEIDLSVVAKNRSGIGCIWLICGVGANNKFYFTTTATLNKGGVNSSTYRLSKSRNTLTIDASGNLALRIKGNPDFRANSVDDPESGNFHISPWTQNLDVTGRDGNPMYFEDSTSSLANFADSILGMVTDLAGGMVPKVKGRIVQSMLVDIIQKVAPNVLNSVLSQLKMDATHDGINVNLPDYLPTPLNSVGLNVGVQLETASSGLVGVNGLGTGYLKASTRIGMTATNSITSNGRPPIPMGTNSFLVYKTSGKLADQSERLGTGNGKYSGVLLALHPDAVNQAVYHLWKNGAINLTLNKDFIETIKAFRSSTRLVEVFENLLRAENMLKILAPGSSKIVARDPNGVDVEILPTDQIEIIINPVTLPVVRPVPISELAQVPCPDNIGNCVIPRVQADLGDMELKIIGRKCPNGACGSTVYDIVKVRANISSKADFGFVAFSNPKNNLDMNGLTAVKILISSNELKYTLEVLEGTNNNPLGLDPQGLWEILDPTVKNLIVPIVNYVLEEIPLPKPQACGISMISPTGTGPAIQTVPVRVADYVSGKEFILVNTKLSSYNYNGDCKL